MYSVSRQWLLLEEAFSLWLAMILFETPDRKRERASLAVLHSTWRKGEISVKMEELQFTSNALSTLHILRISLILNLILALSLHRSTADISP